MSERSTPRLLLAATVGLLLSAPSPTASLDALGHVGTDPVSPLVDVLALAAWGCAAWLLAVFALTALGCAPGIAGRLAATTVHLLAPRAVRHVAELALGITVATGALGVSGASADQHQPAYGSGAQLVAPVSAPVVVPTPVLAPELGPPTSPASPSSSPSGTHEAPEPAGTAANGNGPQDAGPRPSLDWPVSAAAPGPPRGPARPAARRPLPGGAARAMAAVPRATAAVRGTAGAAGAAPDDVLVRAGDCLWNLAARRLGPAATPRRVAAEWPSWWAANRLVIGDDPDLLLPGMHLRPPPATTPGDPR